MSSNEQALVKHEERPAPIQMGTRGVALATFEDVYRFAKVISQTAFAPKDFKTPESIAVALAFGMELGLSPMQSLTGVAVVNGRPSLYGDALIGVVMGSGLCEDLREWIEGDGDDRAAHCETKRKGMPTPILRSFSVRDAKKAGLWGKGGPWTQYSDRMLGMRARGFCLRDAYADVLRGAITIEEAQDIPAQPATVHPMPVAEPETPLPAPEPEPEAIDVEEEPAPPEEHDERATLISEVKALAIQADVMLKTALDHAGYENPSDLSTAELKAWKKRMERRIAEKAKRPLPEPAETPKLELIGREDIATLNALWEAAGLGDDAFGDFEKLFSVSAFDALPTTAMQPAMDWIQSQKRKR